MDTRTRRRDKVIYNPYYLKHTPDRQIHMRARKDEFRQYMLDPTQSSCRFKLISKPLRAGMIFRAYFLYEDKNGVTGKTYLVGVIP